MQLGRVYYAFLLSDEKMRRLAFSFQQGCEEAVGKLSSELLDGENVEGILPKLSQAVFG